jgi:hypothetical protein
VIVDRVFEEFSKAASTCFLHGKTGFPFKCGSSLFSWQTDGIIESGLPLEWGGKVVKRESVTDLQLQQERHNNQWCYLLIDIKSVSIVCVWDLATARVATTFLT